MLHARPASVGGAGTGTGDLLDELTQRLVLVAPALAAGLQGATLDPIEQRRRNAAAHCFGVPAAGIAAANSTLLNRFQRGAGRAGVDSQEHRGAPLAEGAGTLPGAAAPLWAPPPGVELLQALLRTTTPP